MKKLLITLLFIISSTTTSFAAKLYFDAPLKASSNREPVTVLVYLDNEGDIVSGVGGELTFRSDHFSVKEIIAGNSSIPLWATYPSISEERYLDNRTHIVFEGIIPGGFSGVRSAHLMKPGKGLLFIVLLTPKEAGISDIRLDNVDVRAFNEQATLLSSRSYSQRIFIPSQTGKEPSHTVELTYTKNTSPSYLISRSEYTNNQNFIFVQENNPAFLIEKIQVAETDNYLPPLITSSLWRTVDNPHILTYQGRDKYIHLSIIYSNKTYSLITVPPVENLSKEAQSSRILVYIVIVMALLYHYGKIYLPLLFKSKKKSL